MVGLRRLRWAIAALVAAPALALAKPAPAPTAKRDAAGEALQRLDRGMTLYDLGNYEEAAREFAAAKALVPQKANPYRWLGLANVRMGNCKEALPNLDEFLRLVQEGDPRAAEAKEERDRCRARVAGTGVLSVQSTPEGAEVRIDREDGAAAGRTPFRTDAVLLGQRKVFVTMEGHAPGAALVTVGPSEQIVNFVLSPAVAATAAAAAPAKRSIVPAVVAAVVVGLLAAGAAVAVTYLVTQPKMEPTFTPVMVSP